MKYACLILSVLFLVTMCGEKDTRSLHEVLSSAAEPAQVYTIQTDKMDTVETARGILILIPPGAFQHLDGTPVTGEVELSVIEVLDKSEMIKRGISTITTDGQLLESFGMLKMEASREGKELKVNDEPGIGIIFPADGNTKGSLFYGTSSEGPVTWSIDSTNLPVVVRTETIIPLSYGVDSVRVNVDTLYLGDSVGRRGFDDGFEEASDRIFPIVAKNLNWINCDRFLDIANPVELTVKARGKNPYGYLVLDEMNVAIYLFFDEGTAHLDRLPAGLSAQLVVIDREEGDFIWSKMPLVTEERLVIEPALKKIEEKELLEEIERLDQKK